MNCDVRFSPVRYLEQTLSGLCTVCTSYVFSCMHLCVCVCVCLFPPYIVNCVKNAGAF